MPIKFFIVEKEIPEQVVFKLWLFQPLKINTYIGGIV